MKVVLHRSKCIGCGSCVAVCSDYFEMANDGFSHLKGSTSNDGDEILEVAEDKIGCVKEATEVCPVQIIEVT